MFVMLTRSSFYLFSSFAVCRIVPNVPYANGYDYTRSTFRMCEKKSQLPSAGFLNSTENRVVGSIIPYTRDYAFANVNLANSISTGIMGKYMHRYDDNKVTLHSALRNRQPHFRHF